jgi:hypothetical protein
MSRAREDEPVRRSVRTHGTPSYSDTAKRGPRPVKRRAHGPLGVAIPDTDRLDEPRWTGPVERTDPAQYQKPSVHLTWRCPNCRHWTMNGSDQTGRCNLCQTPRPSSGVSACDT